MRIAQNSALKMKEMSGSTLILHDELVTSAGFQGRWQLPRHRNLYGSVLLQCCLAQGAEVERHR